MLYIDILQVSRVKLIFFTSKGNMYFKNDDPILVKVSVNIVRNSRYCSRPVISSWKKIYSNQTKKINTKKKNILKLSVFALNCCYACKYDINQNDLKLLKG
jgi:hypothetical protein